MVYRGVTRGMRRGSILLLRAWGGPGPSPESERGETEEVTLPSPGARSEGRSLFSVGPLPCPRRCRGLGPGCGARHSREAGGLELGPTRRHGVSWPGMALAREVGVGAERRSEQRRVGEGPKEGGGGTTMLADWRDWGCVSL